MFGMQQPLLAGIDRKPRFLLTTINKDKFDDAHCEAVILGQWLNFHSSWTPSHYHRNYSINRKGAYILGDIHGMDHFCTKLAPPPYNKPRSCVSKIHTPMVMVWFGNV
jgi:hypothetical protein